MRWLHSLGVFALLLGIFMIIISLLPLIKLGVDLVYKPIPYDPVYILIVGVDNDIATGEERTDVIMLIGINKQTGDIALTNLPRDLLIGKHKINAIYRFDGIEKLKEELSQLTGLTIHKYMVVDYNLFKMLSEELGPVEVTITAPMYYDDYHQGLHIRFDPGTYELKGEELLAYVRFRNDERGDLGRIERQREIMMKLMAKLRNEMDYGKLMALGLKLLSQMKTDVELSEMVYLYSKLKGRYSLNFVEFPYTLDEKGDVYIDENRLSRFRKEMELCKSFLLFEEPRIVVVKNIENYPYNFEYVVEAQWKKRSNWRVQAIDVDLKVKGLSPNASMVFITTRKEKVKNQILKALKKVHPMHRFTIYDCWNLEGAQLYFKILEAVNKQHYYPENFDALVVLGVGGT